MIDKLSYDEIRTISQELKKLADTVEALGKAKDIQELLDFCATVEGYSKFLESTIQINIDADNALEELKSKVK